MSWETGVERREKPNDFLDRLKKIEGDISEVQARELLGELFEYDLGFTWGVLTGGEYQVWPFQEILLKGWFKKDYSLVVAGRGVGKSYLLAVFILLYLIFNPGAKVVLVSSNFRRSKDIFGQMEKFLSHPKSVLLRQCFETDNKAGTKVKIGKDQSGWTLKCLNEAIVKGLPLGGGENLRGERANVLLIDEGLLVSEHIQKTILKPFLTAKLNAKEQSQTREREDKMISAGVMKEEDRTVFSNNKMIVTSSASYQFEYLYEGLFVPYLDAIRGKENKKNKEDEKELLTTPTHFVARLAYNAPPAGSIMDESALNEDVKGKEHNPIVRREYGAEFVDASDSYFDIKKLHDCTVPPGQFPTVQLYGSKRAEYILALDPSYGTAKTSDYFAMGVYMIVPEDHRIYQVHSYGKAGSDIAEHYEYLTYILTHFNIVWFVIDGSGTEFINGYNNSVIAEKHNIKLGYIDADLATDEPQEYNRAIRESKKQWNLTTKRIVYAQPFSAPTLRTMNEYLCDGVSSAKVWFGSGIQHQEDLFQSVINGFSFPYPFKDHEGKTYELVDFIDDQEDWVAQTKRQMALIEVKSIGNGSTLQYNIPTHLRKSTNEKRARRDNYTCLLMAYYSSKHYFNIMKAEERPPMPTFIPVSF
jgi:hypothetical protein